LVTGGTVVVHADPRYTAEFERVLGESGLLDLDRLMTYDGYFDELPLFSTYSQVSFVDDLPFVERNRVLVRAAVEHLGRILDHASSHYAGRPLDFFCAVTVTGWDFFPDGDLLTPRFWRANPSKGVFDHLKLGPPASEGAAMVADWLDHEPGHLLNDDIVTESGEQRLERVFVQRADFPVPPSTIAG
jgi:hypothetical protein